MTCWRTLERSAPSLMRTWAATPSLLTDQPEEDVGADVVVAELRASRSDSSQDLLGLRRERDVPGRRRAALADHLLDLAAHRFEGNAQALQSLRRTPSPSWISPRRMLGPDVRVVEQACFLLGENHHSAGSIGEASSNICALSRGDDGTSVYRHAVLASGRGGWHLGAEGTVGHAESPPQGHRQLAWFQIELERSSMRHSPLSMC